ncbi:hypothetical protein G7Z17_g2088 [Cylindrodendrum hubeiense]|uniref:Fucose-specific lectin n=1 Tax=Cylindrodendrum hubeiense TaxID=595255 RepID=A0A9P5LJG9_9HYPO|nr:hypothetical protein G7Z17_g2088 [Cylindrodendrum hubeiense]
MSLAAILNPIDPEHALVFYHSSQKGRYNLAVHQLSVVCKPSFAYRDRNTADGRIKSPLSDLAVSNFLGLVRVFGIANIPNDFTSSNPEAVITQLSPTFNPVDKPSTALVQPGDFSSIGSCGDANEGYVSFIKEIDGNPHLVTYTITNSKSTAENKDVGTAKYSKLAAHIVNGKPWVFFQHKNGSHIHYKNGSDTSCAEGSHFAVTHGASEPSLMFLYYRNTDGNVARVWCKDDKWSSETEVSSHHIDEGSAIAVVAHEDNIHVFFWNDGQIVQEVDDMPSDDDLCTVGVAAEKI